MTKLLLLSTVQEELGNCVCVGKELFARISDWEQVAVEEESHKRSVFVLSSMHLYVKDTREGSGICGR